MKKIFMFILLISVTSLIAARIPGFSEFQKDVSQQTEKWKGTNNKLKETREYEVGDTQSFWRWDFSDMPPAWMLTSATCRAVGEHCYLFVADDQWNSYMNQDDVDLIMPYLEDYTINSTEYGAIEMDVDLFGPIPDEIDNDPKVIIFYSELGSFQGTAFDGYFSAYNQVTEAQAQQMNPPGHSNECEMIYMTCNPLDPIDPIRISVLAHELQHMIHWGQDANEDIWVNEGCSELAMVYFGLPDPMVGFPTNPDNTLTAWNQDFADYVKVMLYFTYLSEQYDTATDSLIKDIVSEPANSIIGISNQLDANNIEKTFEEIFVDWTIANIIDDPIPDNGLYNYEALELPGFSAVQNHHTFPVDFSSTAHSWAADYIRIYPPEDGIIFDLEIDQDDQQIGIVRKFSDGSGYEVDIETVNENWETVFSADWCANLEYFMIAFPSHRTGNLNYDYTFTEGVSSDHIINAENATLSNYPNPFNPSTEIYFQTTNSHEEARIDIYNLKGQIVRTLEYTNRVDAENIYSIVWNGTDEHGKAVPSGIYLYQLRVGSKILDVKKCLLLK